MERIVQSSSILLTKLRFITLRIKVSTFFSQYLLSMKAHFSSQKALFPQETSEKCLCKFHLILLLEIVSIFNLLLFFPLSCLLLVFNRLWPFPFSFFQWVVRLLKFANNKSDKRSNAMNWRKSEIWANQRENKKAKECANGIQCHGITSRLFVHVLRPEEKTLMRDKAIESQDGAQKRNTHELEWGGRISPAFYSIFQWKSY